MLLELPLKIRLSILSMLSDEWGGPRLSPKPMYYWKTLDFVLFDSELILAPPVPLLLICKQTRDEMLAQFFEHATLYLTFRQLEHQPRSCKRAECERRTSPFRESEQEPSWLHLIRSYEVSFHPEQPFDRTGERRCWSSRGKRVELSLQWQKGYRRELGRLYSLLSSHSTVHVSAKLHIVMHHKHELNEYLDNQENSSSAARVIEHLETRQELALKWETLHITHTYFQRPCVFQTLFMELTLPKCSAHMPLQNFQEHFGRLLLIDPREPVLTIPEPPKETPSFFSLPSEIRLIVYHHLTPPGPPLQFIWGPYVWATISKLGIVNITHTLPTINVMQVSEQLAQEVLDDYFRKCTFTIPAMTNTGASGHLFEERMMSLEASTLHKQFQRVKILVHSRISLDLPPFPYDEHERLCVWIRQHLERICEVLLKAPKLREVTIEYFETPLWSNELRSPEQVRYAFEPLKSLVGRVILHANVGKVAENMERSIRSTLTAYTAVSSLVTN